MELSKFADLVNHIASLRGKQYRDPDTKVTIVIHSPGTVGATPSVDVQSIHAGFDWDSGQIMIFPSEPLTVLSKEQVEAICESVHKGQSWHAFQEYKRHKEEIEKAQARIKELEENLGNIKLVASGLLSEYLMNKGTDLEFIACVTPSKNTIGNGGVWDMWRKLDKMIGDKDEKSQS